MPKFSIISVYNNREQLDDWLLSSLEPEQESLYETILIENSNDQYGSAAAALNAGGEQATGNFYLFAHQDVKLLGEEWLKSAASYLANVTDAGIAGVSGMAAQQGRAADRGRNLIYHGPDKEQWSHGNEIKEPTAVQTLDEQLVIIPSEVFDQHKFNEQICTHWHLYAVEYCLRVNFRTQYQAYTLPLPVWHHSTGMGLDVNYFRDLDRLRKEYRQDVNTIYTTCGSWPTGKWFSVTPMSARNIVGQAYERAPWV